MNDIRLFDPLSMTPLDEALRGLMRPWRAELAERAPQIRLDVSESDGGYLVKAEIPGVRKEDIHVQVDGHRVTLSAEVKQDKDLGGKDARVLCRERLVGWASRSFTLGSAVDADSAEAHYSDGVLELKLQKKPAAGTRRIAIS